ncbi:hypothetical protein P3342_007989 [Pyrenophora teres f. teres]|nr:hypothetical protein P3342_007989 [Pyrenophora teres f. teres]
MTDKVQERFKDRKTRGGRPDGLSRKSARNATIRKHVYDAVKLDTSAETAQRMIPEDRELLGSGWFDRAHPRTVQLLDDDVSDTDLYDEARMLGNEAYELVPQAKEM